MKTHTRLKDKQQNGFNDSTLLVLSAILRDVIMLIVALLEIYAKCQYAEFFLMSDILPNVSKLIQSVILTHVSIMITILQVSFC
jgi:hypothetical protein